MSDEVIGAVRNLQHGPHLPHKFARLEVTAAPYPDLDRRQRELRFRVRTKRVLPVHHREDFARR